MRAYQSILRKTSSIVVSSTFSLKGLMSTVAFTRLKKNSMAAIVLVAGKKNEPLSSSRPHPRDRPVKHLASHLRHQHVANDDIEGAVPDLAQALDAARNRGYLKRAGGQVIVENVSEIIAIFQEQNLPGRLGHMVRGNVKLESDDVLGVGSSRPQSHSPNR